jgi:hypothetical protein
MISEARRCLDRSREPATQTPPPRTPNRQKAANLRLRKNEVSAAAFRDNTGAKGRCNWPQGRYRMSGRVRLGSRRLYGGIPRRGYGQNTVLIERYPPSVASVSTSAVFHRALHAARVIDEAAHSGDIGISFGAPKSISPSWRSRTRSSRS